MTTRRTFRIMHVGMLLMILAGFMAAAPAAQAARSWPTYQQGASNINVYLIKAFLWHRGYSSHIYDDGGYYGPYTTADVRAFERRNGLPVDGITDPAVWEALIFTVQQGSSAPEVVDRLQEHLRIMYGYTKTIASSDGVFGPATYNAVVSFQQSVNLGADGVVGADTWAALVADYPGRYTHGAAALRLSNAGITVTSSLGSAGVGRDRLADKTSLEQIRVKPIQRLIEFKNLSGCPIEVTGGTETWIHQSGVYSHHTGWKIDIAVGTCVGSYIRNNFTQISTVRWRDGYGNVYFRESNPDHWDITYNN